MDDGTNADARGSMVRFRVLSTVLTVMALLPVPIAAAASPAPTPVPGTFAALPAAQPLDLPDHFGPFESRTIAIAGRSGVPAADLGAVVLTLSAAGATDAGYLTAYAAGSPKPGSSNLNYARGRSASNTAIVPVGPSGAIVLTNTSWGTVRVSGFASGYIQAGRADTAGALATVVPTRVLDTRRTADGAVGPFSPRTVRLGGVGGIPASGASAVVVNVTVVAPTVSGYLSAAAGTSMVNFAAGQTVAGLAILPLAGDGTITLTNGSGGSAHLVVDAVGYVRSGPVPGEGYAALRPVRVADTRAGSFATPLAAHETRAFPLSAAPGMPTALSAAAVTITATRATHDGTLAIGPDDTAVAFPTPAFSAGRTGSAFVLTQVGPYGAIDVTNRSDGTVDVIIDVLGYVRLLTPTAPAVAFTARPAPLPAGAITDQPSVLNDVACSGAACVAVGSYTRADGRRAGLIETSSDGSTWTAIRAPLPAGASDAATVLRGVACVSADWCVAVGSTDTGTTDAQRPLVQTLVDGSWRPSTVAGRIGSAGVATDLAAVRCFDRQTCVAWSNSQPGDYPRPFGVAAGDVQGTWTALAMPQDGQDWGYDAVSDVTCYAPAGCLLSSQRWDDDGVLRTGYLDTWNGHAFTETSMGPIGGPAAGFDTLDCVSAALCFGTGTRGNDLDGYASFAAVRVGGTWTYDGSPDIPGHLAGLTCSAAQCVAPAYDVGSDGVVDKAVLTYAAGSWRTSRITLPNDADRDPDWVDEVVTRADCPTPDRCVFAASYLDPAGHRQAAVVRGRPGAWTVTQVPPPTDADADPGLRFTAVSCSATLCTAVGGYLAGGRQRALLETFPASGGPS